MKESQINLIRVTRRFFSSFNNGNYFPYKDSIFYLATYSNFIGSSILSSLSGDKRESLFHNSINIIKDILYSLNYNNYKTYIPKKSFLYDKIIVTWAFSNNFNKDGSLRDRYFNIDSKDLKKTLWFVVYLSKNNPQKIADNIIIFKPTTKKSLNPFGIIKIMFKNIFFIFKNFKYYLALVSNSNYLAEILIKEINPFLNDKIKYILMPFEGQTFQNRLIYLIKEKYAKIKTIGYIHSPPLAMPANFIHKNNSPDQIILSGKDQLYCFTKILGWNKSCIKILPSFRFRKSQKKLNNTIFFPLTVQSPTNILHALKFLDENNFINLKEYKVKNHPAAFNSKKNIKTLNQIEILISNLKNKNRSIKDKYLIFIGNSGGIIEALERGAKVIQICEFPLFDIYSNKIWPSVNSKKIKNNIFAYELKKRGNLIKFGNKKNNLKKIFN